MSQNKNVKTDEIEEGSRSATFTYEIPYHELEIHDMLKDAISTIA